MNRDADPSVMDANVGFWMGVWHRAGPGSPHLSPSNPPTGFSPAFRADWRKGWTDADQVAKDEGFEALQEYGEKAHRIIVLVEKALYDAAGMEHPDG